MTVIISLLLNFFCAFVSSGEIVNPNFYLLNFLAPGGYTTLQVSLPQPLPSETKPYYSLPVREYHRILPTQ